MVSEEDNSSRLEEKPELLKGTRKCRQTKKKSLKRSNESKDSKSSSPRKGKQSSPTPIPTETVELTDELKLLLKLFSMMDNTIMFLEARGEPFVFHKLLPSLGKLCKCDVKISDLAKLRTVYPEAYEYRPAYSYAQGMRVRSIMMSIPEGKGRSSDHPTHGTITPPPRTPEDSQQSPFPCADSSTPTRCIKLSPRTPPPRRPPNSPPPNLYLELPRLYTDTVAMKERLKERYVTLRLRLIALVKDALPNAPDILPHSMPELQLADPESQVVSPKTPRTPVKRTIPASPLKRKLFTHSSHPALDLTPKTARMKQILERVRLRQQEVSSPRSKQSISRKAILSRLPSMAHALSFLYSSFQKSVLPLDTVFNRLKKCLPPSSDSTVRDHIDELIKLVPDWCSIIEHDSRSFLKIKIEQKLADVRLDLENRVQDAINEED